MSIQPGKRFDRTRFVPWRPSFSANVSLAPAPLWPLDGSVFVDPPDQDPPQAEEDPFPLPSPPPLPAPAEPIPPAPQAGWEN